MAPLRMETTVHPGHRIEISAPELPEGMRVVIIITPASTPQPKRASALEIIESLRGHRVFETPEQVRRHLDEERDAWDR